MSSDLSDLPTSTSNSAFKDLVQSHQSQSHKSLWLSGPGSHHRAAVLKVHVLAETALHDHFKSQANME